MKRLKEAKNLGVNSRPKKRRDTRDEIVTSVFGNKYVAKQEDQWRVLMMNINTIPSSKNMVKLDQWRKIAVESDINIIVETNKDQRKLHEDDKTENLIKGWWQKPSVRDEYLVEQNQKFNDLTARQQGGVSMITNDDFLGHVCKSGGDERKLGRWRWTTVRGQQGRMTTIIGTYRAEVGWATTDNQLAEIRQTEEGAKQLSDPIKLWYSDLKALIQQKQDDGHSIIVAGDFNEDLTSPTSKVKDLFHDLQLRETIMEKHNGITPPNTYMHGKKPIDGIFASMDIEINKGGYIDVLDSPGDHCGLWIDIKKTELVGETMQIQTKKMTRKVTSKIPSVKKKFQELMEEQVVLHKLREKVDTLFEDCIEAMKTHDKLPTEMENRMDALFSRVTRAKMYADKNCRKLRVGNIPYSKQIQQALGACIVLKIIQN